MANTNQNRVKYIRNPHEIPRTKQAWNQLGVVHQGSDEPFQRPSRLMLIEAKFEVHSHDLIPIQMGYGYIWMYMGPVDIYAGWWLNQPIWKICSSKWVHLPQGSGWK